MTQSADEWRIRLKKNIYINHKNFFRALSVHVEVKVAAWRRIKHKRTPLNEQTGERAKTSFFFYLISFFGRFSADGHGSHIRKTAILNCVNDPRHFFLFAFLLDICVLSVRFVSLLFCGYERGKADDDRIDNDQLPMVWLRWQQETQTRVGAGSPALLISAEKNRNNTQVNGISFSVEATSRGLIGIPEPWRFSKPSHDTHLNWHFLFANRAGSEVRKRRHLQKWGNTVSIYTYRLSDCGDRNFFPGHVFISTTAGNA